MGWVDMSDEYKGAMNEMLELLVDHMQSFPKQPDEFTITDLKETYGITLDRRTIGYKLVKLTNQGILERRRISYLGCRPYAYKFVVNGEEGMKKILEALGIKDDEN